MKHMETCTIYDIKALNDEVFSLTLETRNIAQIAQAGQFVNVYLNNGETILPRPISICDVIDNKIILLIAVVGKGTGSMRLLKKGDTIRILGPLGNGFMLDSRVAVSQMQKQSFCIWRTPRSEQVSYLAALSRVLNRCHAPWGGVVHLQSEKHVLVGGGIGIAPLYFLSKQLKGDITAILGYKEQSFYKDKFSKTCQNVYISSDLGIEGIKGNVLDVIKYHKIDDFDMMYVCGPKVMMKAIVKHFETKQHKIQVSLEERMACGISVCLACVCKKNDGTKAKVCGDGPVFMSKDVVL